MRFGATSPAGRGNAQTLLHVRPGRVEREDDAILHAADYAEHILFLDVRTDIRTERGVKAVKFAVEKLADHIKDVRVVAERAAAETVVALADLYTLAVALFRYALPRERPDRRKRRIRSLDRQNLSELAEAIASFIRRTTGL